MEDYNNENKPWDTEAFIDALNTIRQTDVKRIMYCPVTDEMLPYVERYVSRHFDEIGTELQNGGADPETVKAVLTDYAMTAAAGCSMTANREQMLEALRIISPIRAFSIDRYVFYHVMTGYRDFLSFSALYKSAVLDERTATTETKKTFIYGRPNASGSRIFVQLLVEQEIDIEQFGGIDRDYLDNCIQLRVLASTAHTYISVIMFCRYAYIVPDEMMKAIPNTAGLTNDLIDKALEMLREMQKELSQGFAKLIEAAEEENPAKIAQAKQEIKLQENEITSGKYAISQILTQLNSRDIFGCVEAQQERKKGLGIVQGDIRPIMSFVKYIDEFPDIPITTTTVHNALSGLIRLYNANPTVYPVNDTLTYKTSLRKFASFCFEGESSNTERLALLKSLLLIDRAGWLCIWKADGIHAVRPVHIPDINVSSGEFIIAIHKQALTGHQNIVSAEQYNNLRKEKRHEAKRNLYHQLIGKHHKEQVHLINEIYSYDTYLANITDEDEKAKFLRQWQKNFPTKKKNVELWLNEFKKKGIIRDWILDPSTNVYRWIPHVEGQQELFADEDFKPEKEKSQGRKKKGYIKKQ